MTSAAVVGEGVYPGWVEDGWAWRGAIPGTHPDPPGPIFSILLALGPYLRPNGAFYEVSMRFPEMGLELVQN